MQFQSPAAEAGPRSGGPVPGAPSKLWLQKVVQQLRACFGACQAKQLTVSLWSLGRLGLKAPVDWLDALYDALLPQLAACSTEQLLQLLQGLLHQQHELAPARIDSVLDAFLVKLQAAAGGGSPPQRAGQQQQQQPLVALGDVLWLLQAVAQLRHQPQPSWCAGMATAIQGMLLQQQQQSALPGASTACTPDVLADLLHYLMLLDFEPSASWAAAYRGVVSPLLPRFTGKQLALLLSSAASLRWFRPERGASSMRMAPDAMQQQRQRQQQRGAAGRVFLRRVLMQLRRHLLQLPPTSLGLTGVAVSQLELIMHAKRWCCPYITQVTTLVAGATRMPAPQAADLQRSIQYLRWTQRSREQQQHQGRQAKHNRSSSSSSSRRRASKQHALAGAGSRQLRWPQRLPRARSSKSTPATGRVAPKSDRQRGRFVQRGKR